MPCPYIAAMIDLKGHEGMKKWQAHGNMETEKLISGGLGSWMEKATALCKAQPLYYIQ